METFSLVNEDLVYRTKKYQIMFEDYTIFVTKKWLENPSTKEFTCTHTIDNENSVRSMVGSFWVELVEFITLLD